MRLAVLVHLFDFRLIDEFRQYLENITLAGYSYDLYIAIPQHEEAERIRITWPDAVVVPHENRGFDIGSFFSLLSYAFNKKYDLILKLHSKSRNWWRKELIEPLLGSPEKVRNCIELFNDSKIGMVGSRKWLLTVPKGWGLH